MVRNNKIISIKADSGDILWQRDYGGIKPARRGMFLDQKSRRIYLAVGNRLCAISTTDGGNSSFGNNGCINTGFTSVVTPKLYKDLIIYASLKPALHAYDLMGNEKWVTNFTDISNSNFSHLYSENMKIPGGNPWGGISIDKDRGIAYVSTGNPQPPMVGVDRPGDNKHTNSILAINIKNGELLWSFQEVAHDIWDMDIPNAPVLTTIVKNKVRVDVVVSTTKAGNVILLDRVSGEPIFDWRLKRVDVSHLPGERSSPFQPEVELPEPFSKQEFGLNDVTNIGEKNKEYVLSRIKGANYGFFVPHEENVDSVFFGIHGGSTWPGPTVDQKNAMLYVASNHIPWIMKIKDAAKGLTGKGKSLLDDSSFNQYLRHCASCHGADLSGQGAPALINLSEQYDSKSLKNLIVNGFEGMQPITNISDENLNQVVEFLLNHKGGGHLNPVFKQTGWFQLLDNEGYPGSLPPWGTLNAIDLNTGKTKWRVALGEYEQLIKKGFPPTGTENIGGPTVTAGGVIFVSGTKDKMLRVFDVENGDELWRWKLPFFGTSQPITYKINGEQYVFIVASGGGKLRDFDKNIKAGNSFLAFKIKEL